MPVKWGGAETLFRLTGSIIRFQSTSHPRLVIQQGVNFFREIGENWDQAQVLKYNTLSICQCTTQYVYNYSIAIEKVHEPYSP
jgi:hypothetical protein